MQEKSERKNAMKMIPLEKQSKSAQRSYHQARRGSWNGLSPVTRVVASRKGYNRRRDRKIPTE